jgi:GNAT superfamily N-acetyltransferase
MTIHDRAYEPSDFLLVRDFLKHNYYAFGSPTNWGMERWNWGRYHPMVFAGDRAGHIRHFEDSVRLWFDAKGRMLAVLNTENPMPNGEAWIQRHPDADPVLDRILAYAETALADPVSGILSLDVYDHDLALRQAAGRRGYQADDHVNWWSAIPIEAERALRLPAGYRIQSMADPDHDLGKRCSAMGRGFNHADPVEWSTPEEYRLVQTAPDYQAENDLVVQSPDGDYVSLCLVWYDGHNRIGFFEPVCTVPEYRRMGLGRAVIQAGLNRLYRLGARLAYVGSGQDFYAAIGFQRQNQSRAWRKTCKTTI